MTLPRLVESLLRPEAYPERPERVELIQTHISYILLTERFAYKIKKPVNFGFLDFSTLRRRRFFCREEVRLNRRLSPEIYLGVVEVVERDGEYFMEGEGEVRDYAVKMKRLPEKGMMRTLLKEGRVTEGMVRRVSERISSFYRAERTSPYIASFGRPEVIRRNTEENFRQTEPYIGRTIEEEEFAGIRDYTRSFLSERRDLFTRRMEEGWIKDCHGDLHSGSICFEDGLVIFDCIEFNRRFRYSDTLADIAFLAMDLDFHFRKDLSEALIRYYQEFMDDRGIEDLLTFYKVYRAYVRGKVEGFEIDEEEVPMEEKDRLLRRARRYFRLAMAYTRRSPFPILIAVCGLLGTGKTTVALELGRRFNGEVIHSDRLRKELAGIRVEEHLYLPFGKGIYSERFTKRTYREMIRRAEGFLRDGRNVILDATFSREWMREEVRELGRRVGVEVVFLECTAPEGIIRDRLLKRVREGRALSDGRWEIYLRMKGIFQPFRQGEAFRVDTSDQACLDSFMEWLGF